MDPGARHDGPVCGVPECRSEKCHLDCDLDGHGENLEKWVGTQGLKNSNCATSDAARSFQGCNLQQ